MSVTINLYLNLLCNTIARNPILFQLLKVSNTQVTQNTFLEKKFKTQWVMQHDTGKCCMKMQAVLCRGNCKVSTSF